MDSLEQVCAWMGTNQFGEFTSESKDRIFVYWRSIQEVAEAIHKWADDTGRIGSVETVLDLCDDDENKKTNKTELLRPKICTIYIKL